jgi:hypothetical protein
MSKHKIKEPQDPDRGRTDVEGQNPKANDATDQDLYHDENRRNMYDPEVGKALRGSDKKSKS